MKTLNRVLSLVLCAMICISFVTTVSAATTPKITVTNVTAQAGDSVEIHIEISNNPGIMAMAFCVTYDPDALVYKNYMAGYLTASGYNLHNHEDKGHVSFVHVESNDKINDNTNNKILTLLFDVKSDAKPGKHVITLANSNREKHGTKLHNSFSNSKQEFVVPKVVSGGVTIPETCENSGHKYGEWDIIKPANCTETGLKKHSCVRGDCDAQEEVEIPITHDFEQDFTIDKAATPTEDGIMSRHCTKCDAVTDKITFSYEEIGGDSNDSNSDASSKDDNSSNKDTSSDESKNEDASSDDKSSNTSSNSTSSNANSNSSNNVSSTTTNNNSATNNDSSSQNPKPNFNNVVGEKVPLNEVEKLEDYQQTIKPNLDNSNTSSQTTPSQITSDNDTSSETTSIDQDKTIGAAENNNTIEKKEEPSYFSTTTGIVTVVICSLLSIGIIALGIFLIIKNKKQ